MTDIRQIKQMVEECIDSVDEESAAHERLILISDALTENDLLPRVERLRLQDGDILVLTGSFDLPVLDDLMRNLNARHKGVTVWVNENGQTVEILTTEQMRQAGWVRPGEEKE